MGDQEAKLEALANANAKRFADMQVAFTISSKAQTEAASQGAEVLEAIRSRPSSSANEEWGRTIDPCVIVFSAKKMVDREAAKSIIDRLCRYAAIPSEPIPYIFTTNILCDKVHKVKFNTLKNQKVKMAIYQIEKITSR